MGCRNSKEVQVLEIVEVSIEIIQNSILNICESDIECAYNFCDKCILYKTDNITHCKRCDECHDNRKTLFCEFCSTCINFNLDVDIMNHRKRHEICKLLRDTHKKRNRSI